MYSVLIYFWSIQFLSDQEFFFRYLRYLIKSYTHFYFLFFVVLELLCLIICINCYTYLFILCIIIAYCTVILLKIFMIKESRKNLLDAKFNSWNKILLYSWFSTEIDLFWTSRFQKAYKGLGGNLPIRPVLCTFRGRFNVGKTTKPFGWVFWSQIWSEPVQCSHLALFDLLSVVSASCCFFTLSARLRFSIFRRSESIL